MVPDSIFADGGEMLARLQGVSLSRAGVTILENVSVTIERGQVLALAGPSGSGKTTLLHVLFDRLGEGNASCETGVTRMELFPQDARAALNPALSIERQLRLIKRFASREVMAKWLGTAGIEEPASVLDRSPSMLSGGECQRVVWAIILSREPDLVLLDEPTSALDEERESALLQSAVDGVIPGGGALVVVTHNPRIVLDFCSHLIVLDNGRVVESGAVPSLCGKAAHPYTRAILRLDSR